MTEAPRFEDTSKILFYKVSSTMTLFLEEVLKQSSIELMLTIENGSHPVYLTETVPVTSTNTEKLYYGQEILKMKDIVWTD